MTLIEWTCETCGVDTHGKGAIHIPFASIRAISEAEKAWERRDRLAGTQFTLSHDSDELMAPPPALWKVECDRCAGTCDGSYDIGLWQVRTVADLDRWTEHLSSKTWLSASNWSMVVASVAERMTV
jgi:hypothetical protein